MNEFIVIITSVLIGGMSIGYHIKSVMVDRQLARILKKRQTIEIKNMSYYQLREELRLSRQRIIEITERLKKLIWRLVHGL